MGLFFCKKFYEIIRLAYCKDGESLIILSLKGKNNYLLLGIIRGAIP